MRKRRSIVWSIPKEKLLELVETSNSIKELVGKIGLNNKSGSNDATVKKCLESHGIDWKPLALKGIKNKGQDFNNLKVPASELFSSNSKHGRSVVRKRVIQENLIPYKCAICGQEPEWNGKPMPLILDHINGVRDDHRLENLRFVCGNCNLQLDTTNGKNNSKRRKELREQLRKYREANGRTAEGKGICPIGGGEMTYNAKMCKECRLKNPLYHGGIKGDKGTKESPCPPKEQLTQDILTMSNVQIGKKYGVSDNAIRRWLKKYNLPVSYKEIKNYRQKYNL